MGVKVTLGLDKFKSFLRRFKMWVRRRPEDVARGLSDCAELILRRATTHYLTGGALNVRTGRLRQSVKKVPSYGAFRMGKTFVVQVGSNVSYGAAWEKGFTVHEWYVHPVKKKALHWVKGGTDYFSKGHTIPTYKVKARPWLQPSLEDVKPQMTAILEKVGVNFS